MPDQDLYPVSITEPWPRQRNRWVIVASVLGFVTAILAIMVDYNRLDPIRQFYVSAYLRTNIQWIAGKESTFDFLELTQRGRIEFAVPGDAVADRSEPYGLALSPRANDEGATGLHKVRREHVPTIRVYNLLRKHIYDGKSLLAVFPFASWTLLGLVPLGLLAGSSADYRFRRRLLKGIVRRGPRLVDRYSFNKARQSDGIGFRTEDPITWRERLDPKYPPALRGRIAIPKRSENSHIALMGSSGTGKSILLRQLLREIQARGEAAIVYDPAGEFTAEFYNEARGDTILNPLDDRSPFWTPVDELSTNTEALTLAESLFPDTHTENQFFVRAPRKIFAHLLEYGPDPDQLAYWLSMPDEIDKRVAGTEMAHMLAKAAGAQRAGVLSSLGIVADSLRMLPTENDVKRPDGTVRRWSARKWAEARKGWIFLTSTTTTRPSQRPLQSMWLDTLILRLMKTSPERVTRPAWLVLDELASLQRLPQLETALTEARKYQIKIVLGFQGQSQIQERYGDKGAETILGQAATKIYLRTNEPNAAEWISKALGDQEVERVRETRSLQEGIQSKNSQSYARELKTERAVTTAQVLGLTDRHGYIKQENVIARFILPIVPPRYLGPALIERKQLEFTRLMLEEDSPVAGRADTPGPVNGADSVAPPADRPTLLNPLDDPLSEVDETSPAVDPAPELPKVSAASPIPSPTVKIATSAAQPPASELQLPADAAVSRRRFAVKE
jgi:hypothetical protein